MDNEKHIDVKEQDDNHSMNSQKAKNEEKFEIQGEFEIQEEPKRVPDTCFYQDKFQIDEAQMIQDSFPVQKVSRDILKYASDKKKLYDKIDQALRNESKYRPDHDYIDVISRNFLNDRLIPDEDAETNRLVLQILGDFLYQISKINNFKARYQVSDIIKDAIISKKKQIAEHQSQLEKPLSNLTFNHKVYNDYVRRTAEMQVDGDPQQDHLVTLLDYLHNPCIPIKNYVVIGDIQCGLQKLRNNQEKFHMVQKKLDHLRQYRYPVETRLDIDVKPMLETEVEQYMTSFIRINEAYKKNPIVVEDAKSGKHIEWFLSNHGNQMPPINQLSGFQSFLKEMPSQSQQLFNQGIQDNDKSKMAEFIVSYIKELFWVFQAFLSSRLKILKSIITTSKMKDDLVQIKQLDDPFALQDAINIEVIVNSSEKIMEVFECLAKFKQIQIAQVKPQFDDLQKQVVVDFVFYKKIPGRCQIRLQSYTIHQSQNISLSKLVHASNLPEFQNHIMDQLTVLTAQGNTYMPYYNPQIWTQQCSKLKKEYIQRKEQFENKKADKQEINFKDQQK